VQLALDPALPRCGWAAHDPLLAHYHDVEWGHPPEDDDALFEALSLEIFQAGLSWSTILRKRPGFRRAFAGFAIDVVAEFTPDVIQELLLDAAIDRHRQKIAATIANARAVQQIQQEAGSFREWLAAVPDDTEQVYQALRPRLTFFGRTTCESFLHAVGKVPAPHDPICWRARS
jgi:DNA-3-methyladenine glycosylase I